jgi:hypothetical protein
MVDQLLRPKGRIGFSKSRSLAGLHLSGVERVQRAQHTFLAEDGPVRRGNECAIFIRCLGGLAGQYDAIA